MILRTWQTHSSVRGNLNDVDNQHRHFCILVAVHVRWTRTKGVVVLLLPAPRHDGASDFYLSIQDAISRVSRCTR